MLERAWARHLPTRLDCAACCRTIGRFTPATAGHERQVQLICRLTWPARRTPRWQVLLIPLLRGPSPPTVTRSASRGASCCLELSTSQTSSTRLACAACCRTIGRFTPATAGHERSVQVICLLTWPARLTPRWQDSFSPLLRGPSPPTVHRPASHSAMLGQASGRASGVLRTKGVPWPTPSCSMRDSVSRRLYIRLTAVCPVPCAMYHVCFVFVSLGGPVVVLTPVSLVRVPSLF